MAVRNVLSLIKKTEVLKFTSRKSNNERTANAIAKQVGIKEVIANVLPEDKANKIKELRLTKFSTFCYLNIIKIK